MRGRSYYRRGKKRLGQKSKYKSRLEERFAQMMQEKGLPFQYEPDRLPYVRSSVYVPDWKIRKDVYIETKGYLSPSNRANMLSFKEQHPGVRIYFIFGNANNRLNSRSSTTYGEWATKHGFRWRDIKKGIPLDWWQE